MQIIRTIVLVVVVIVLLVFSINNWTPVEVKIWEDLVLETKLPALVIVSFLAGLLPVWILHQSTRWRLKRRIKSLETAVRNAVGAPAEEPAPAPEAHPEVSPQPDRQEGQ